MSRTVGLRRRSSNPVAGSPAVASPLRLPSAGVVTQRCFVRPVAVHGRSDRPRCRGVRLRRRHHTVGAPAHSRPTCRPAPCPTGRGARTVARSARQRVCWNPLLGDSAPGGARTPPGLDTGWRSDARPNRTANCCSPRSTNSSTRQHMTSRRSGGDRAAPSGEGPVLPERHHDGVGDRRRDQVAGPRPPTGQRRGRPVRRLPRRIEV
jgi:hypothetical protein